MKFNKKFYAFILLIVLTVSGIIFISNSSNQNEDNDEWEEIETQTTQTEAKEDLQDNICVYICGEVVNPGVYELKNGSRIYDALKQAGGFSPNAAKEYINLAESLRDGQQILVPGQEDIKSLSVSNQSGDGLVNINTASAEELTTLAGIGKSRAEAIISYRDNNGGFSSIEDIMQVSGIKEGAFQKIKDYIKV